MKIRNLILLAFGLLPFFAAAQTATFDRVRVRQGLTIRAEKADSIIRAVTALSNHTSIPTAKAVWDAIAAIVAASKYQTLRDDGSNMTQQPAANFVSTGTVAFTLTNDPGNLETEVAAAVPTGGITTTEILDGTIANADISSTANIANSKLANSGVTASSYPSTAGSTVQFAVNSKGIITSATTIPLDDPSATNEGTLGVGAGSGSTSVITSNTSGANGVTIAAGTGIGISETTSSNGGTITITNTGDTDPANDLTVSDTVRTVSAASTHSKYPTAAAVYNAIAAVGSGGPDSTFALAPGGGYADKRINSNVYRTGKVSVGTTDTTGRVNLTGNSTHPPLQLVPTARESGAGITYARLKNVGGNYENWNVSSFASPNNSTAYGITDPRPNSVLRIGYNATAGTAVESGATSFFDSWEPNWWGASNVDGTPRNHYERHWQMLDSAGNEHRPLTGYFEKRANGYGSLAANVTYLDLLDWNYAQRAQMTINRNSEARIGSLSVFNDSLYTIDLSNIGASAAAFLSSANKTSGDATGKGTSLIFGGLGTVGAASSLMARYNSTNNQNGLDLIFGTQAISNGAQLERFTIKSGSTSTLVGVNTTSPVQTLQVNGTALVAGGNLRVNNAADSAALILRMNSTQTEPIFRVRNSADTEAWWMHRYNSSNPSFALGRVGTVGATSPNNLVVGFTNASFANGAGGNTVIGMNAANAHASGYENTIIGWGAGEDMVDGFQNTVIGGLAGANITSGYQNMFLGRRAGLSLTTGAVNVGIGSDALRLGVTSVGNVGIGTQAGDQNTGNENVFIGTAAGRTNTGSNNVFIGNAAGELESGSNKLIVDNNNTSTPLIRGDFANDRLGINLSSAPTQTLHVGGNSLTQGRATIQSTGANAALYLNNTTDPTGKEWYINSVNAGSLVVGNPTTADALTINGTTGAVSVANTLTVGSATGTAASIAALTSGGVVTTATIGSGLSLSGGTLSATGGATDLGFTGASSPVTLTSSTGADVTITAGGINSLSATGTNLTITATEAQTLSNTSDPTSHTVTITNTGGSVQFVEGSGITLTTTGTSGAGVVTIAASGGGGGSPSVETLTEWASDQDNVSINSATTTLRVSGDNGVRGLTSINASGMTSGREFNILNVGTHPVVIQAQHPDGGSANKFDILQDVVLAPKSSCRAIYDGTSTAFRVIADAAKTQRKFGRGINANSVTASELGYMQVQTDFGSATTFAATSTLPAAFSANSGANSGGDCYIIPSKGVSGLFTVGSAYAYFRSVVTIPTLSDGTQGFYCMNGFFSAATNPPNVNFTNMAGILYSHSENSGKWIAYTASASNVSTADLGVTVAANTPYTLEIYLNKQNNEARYFVNGAYAGRITTNMPTSGTVMMPISGISKTIGSTSRSVYVHEVEYWGIFSN